MPSITGVPERRAQGQDLAISRCMNPSRTCSSHHEGAQEEREYPVARGEYRHAKQCQRLGTYILVSTIRLMDLLNT
jgi:hypothetical protein